LSARSPRLQPGFVAFNSNRAENLAEVVASWLQRSPLPPLTEEVILVQSNGMAEWLKMELARRGGVCAATRVELPSRFLWRTYRQVLGAQAVPSESPLDKLPMAWRLMQLLPGLLGDPVFAPVAGFLRDDDAARLLQLATQLADLFDQYQNYRSDWLEAWAAGHNHVLLANGSAQALASDQLWQSALWRALLATLTPAQQQSIRPRLHQQFLNRLGSSEPLERAVAQRVTAFGMSQMPGATLQALAALAPHSQVILAIPNPCRYYWGDIMEGRDLLRAQRRRQPLRNGHALTDMPLQDMHAHAHPLLAAWGRQSRDFVRLLDAYDDAPRSQQQFALAKIDYFDDSDEGTDSPLLQQVQNRIRDLVPLHEHPARAIDARDRSIVFHSAHSAVRELEVLHDQLLQALAQPSGPAQAPLKPRDIIVMVPDIEALAPAIRAVFGQYKRGDARFIPFDIADMGAQASSPLIGAVAWLLRLPAQRCRMSELLDLLEVPAVAARFGVASEALPQLTQWMVGAGIRWGLDAAHRADLGLGACGEQNSAWFGLRRMLLGYASGADAVDAPLAELHTIAPYAEVGGLQAELAGSLAHLLHALTRWWALATVEATPLEWVQHCQTLLTDLLQAESEEDRLALSALQDGLWAWQSACEQAGFDQAVPLAVLRAAWLQALALPKPQQRFRAGGITFCTLMPMRAIPFEVVCLLGMNDGDYPRRSSHSDFDLMALPGAARPGDRSRRDDDRQLMLESVLSARRLLYVSWSGRNVRDNAEQPASVLVAQLRDYLRAGWGDAVVSSSTTEHPLQPFSRRYFEADSALFTYAREWRAMHQQTSASGSESDQDLTGHALSPFVPNPTVPLTLQQLTQFLRKPVKAFFRQRLLVAFGDDTPAQWDDERFSVGGLDEYQLVQTLLEGASRAPSAESATAEAQVALARLRQSGALPLQALGDLAQQQLQDTLAAMLGAWHAQQARFAHPAPRQPLRLQAGEVLLEDWVDGLRQALPSDAGGEMQTAWLQLEPGNLCAKTTKPKPRPEQLLGAWLRSLASAASGVQALGVVVGRDSVIEITPMDPELARTTLQRLLQLWQAGMQAPLPLPPKTALAWLAQAQQPDKAQQAARAQYEGAEHLRGDVEEACVARVFPDLEALQSDGQFAALAQAMYQPLLDWQKTHVRATLHPKQGADAGASDEDENWGTP
jgi:exodeoxyribonuclease V gamma subunit